MSLLMQSESRLKRENIVVREETGTGLIGFGDSFISQIVQYSLLKQEEPPESILGFADSRFGFQFSVHQLPVV